MAIFAAGFPLPHASRYTGAMNEKPDIHVAAQRVIELEAELEAASDALTRDADIAFIRTALHEWVDSVVGAVASPGVGRVTLIHADGLQSRIASPDLPYRLSRPVRFNQT